MTDATTLERARQSLDAHAWQQAYEGFVVARDAGDLSSEDLERLAEAAWWSAHPNESIEAFERAYAAFSAEGRRRDARPGRLRLAMEYADRLDSAVWNGVAATRLPAAGGRAGVRRARVARALPRPIGVRAGRRRGASSGTRSRAQEIGARFG